MPPKITTLKDAQDNPDLYVGSGQNVIDGNNRRSDNPMIQDLLQQAESRAPDTSEAVLRTLVMYRNGFLLHKTFYSNDNEEGMRILRALKSGHAPLDLLEINKDEQVELSMMQKMTEDYVAPFVAFHGSGNRLGAPTLTQPTLPTTEPTQLNEPVPALDANDPNNMVLQVKKSDGQRIKHVCRRDSTVQQVNTDLGGVLFHSYPSKAVESLLNCEKEVLMLVNKS